MNSTASDVLLSLVSFLERYAPLLSALLVFELVLRLIAIWDVLRQERGADRICWFLVLITLPFFGLIAYVCIALDERDKRFNFAAKSGNGLSEPSDENLAWAQAKLEKELNTPAQTEKEWVARYLKK